MIETNYSDEWKKFIHSIPALYLAIEKDSSITVGEFLHLQVCVETTYDQLQLSVRAINCLDREMNKADDTMQILYVRCGQEPQVVSVPRELAELQNLWAV